MMVLFFNAENAKARKDPQRAPLILQKQILV